MREIFLAPSDSTDTSLVLRAEDGEEFFLEVTDELRAVLEPAHDAATAGRRFALGLAGTALFVGPRLTILAPVIGAAMATHLYHGTDR